jgi:putative alpha-1,2-mannosidase
MVKLGPDLVTGGNSYSGYDPGGNFTGFSMMHESGTGGAPKYGVVSQMPILGNITNPLDNLNDTRRAPDVTSVGYYKALDPMSRSNSAPPAELDSINTRSQLGVSPTL